MIKPFQSRSIFSNLKPAVNPSLFINLYIFKNYVKNTQKQYYGKKMKILGTTKSLKDTFNIKDLKSHKKWPAPDKDTIVAFGVYIGSYMDSDTEEPNYRLTECENEQDFNQTTAIDKKNSLGFTYYKLTPK